MQQYAWPINRINIHSKFNTEKLIKNCLPSISSQCPVKTHMQTIVTDKAKETSSAAVNLPHMPNDILKRQIVWSHYQENSLPNTQGSPKAYLNFFYKINNILHVRQCCAIKL